MKVVIQRVKEASVTIDHKIHAAIGSGLLILLGIETEDTKDDADKLISKITKLRIFNDENGKMNLSCIEVKGSYLVISQFTLHADTRKGNRPSYIKAARPDQAIPLYEYFISQLQKESGSQVRTGQFGADMQVGLINDGPVTIIIDTKD